MRKLVLKLHLWLSVGLGLFIVVMCTTGSLLLVNDDMEKVIHPDLYQTTSGSGNAPLQTIIQNVKKNYPDFEVNRLDLTKKDGIMQVLINKGKKTSHTLYVDPSSGKILGNLDDEPNSLYSILYNLHSYLFVGNIFGESKAAIITGLIGVGFVVILITGMYLWWPTIRKMSTAFRVNLKKGKFLFNLSLHKTIGIITVPFLLVFALTGVAMELDPFFGMSITPKETAPKAWLNTEANQGQPLSMDKLVKNVNLAYPTISLERIQIPPKKNKTYQFFMHEGISPDKRNAVVFVDQYSGEVKGKTDIYKPINFYYSWKKGLHLVSYGGNILKYLSFLVGMMPLILMVTGITIWRLKASKKLKVKRQKRLTNEVESVGSVNL